MISPTDQQVHCWAWLKKHMPEDSNLLLEDVTWKYTGRRSLWGQLRRERPACPDVSSPFAFFLFDIQKWGSESEACRRLSGRTASLSDTQVFVSAVCAELCFSCGLFCLLLYPYSQHGGVQILPK